MNAATMTSADLAKLNAAELEVSSARQQLTNPPSSLFSGGQRSSSCDLRVPEVPSFAIATPPDREWSGELADGEVVASCNLSGVRSEDLDDSPCSFAIHTPRKSAWELQAVAAGDPCGTACAVDPVQRAWLEPPVRRLLPPSPEARHVHGEKLERRQLCDMLWACLRNLGYPNKAVRLVAAERLLASLGIRSLPRLVEELRAGPTLRQRIQDSGLRPFCEPDLAGLEARADEALLAAAAAEVAVAILSPGSSCKSAGSPERRMSLHQHTSERRQQRCSLVETLWESQRLWSPAELAAAERKLSSVGIKDMVALDRAMAMGLNERLRVAGLKPFAADALASLQLWLDGVHGRSWMDKGAAWLHAPEEPGPDLRLLSALWETRPDWSRQELQRAALKLRSLGIDRTEALAAALEGGKRNLNDSLQAAGLRRFSPDTLRGLRRRLGVTAASRSQLLCTSGCSASAAVRLANSPQRRPGSIVSSPSTSRVSIDHSPRLSD